MKLKKFFAALLTVAMVASFATVSYALETAENFYTWKTVVTPSAVDPAGTATIEVYILGNDGEDIIFARKNTSTISATLNLSTDVFALTNDDYIDDYLVTDVNGAVSASMSIANKLIVVALDATPSKAGGITISPDEPVFTLENLPVSANAVPGSYVIDVDSTMSTLTDASVSPVVSVKGGAVEGTLTVNGGEEEGTSTKFEYTDGNTYALSKNAFAFNGTDYDFDKKYDVVVKYNNAETKTYAWSWKNDLGIDGVGEVSGNVKFGVKISDPVTYDATLFTFDLVEVQ